MVLVIVIIDGVSKELHVCCAGHARRLMERAINVSWWETIDNMGHVVDSADVLLEEAEQRLKKCKKG